MNATINILPKIEYDYFIKNSTILIRHFNLKLSGFHNCQASAILSDVYALFGLYLEVYGNGTFKKNEIGL